MNKKYNARILNITNDTEKNRLEWWLMVPKDFPLGDPFGKDKSVKKISYYGTDKSFNQLQQELMKLEIIVKTKEDVDRVWRQLEKLPIIVTNFCDSIFIHSLSNPKIKNDLPTDAQCGEMAVDDKELGEAVAKAAPMRDALHKALDQILNNYGVA